MHMDFSEILETWWDSSSDWSAAMDGPQAYHLSITGLSPLKSQEDWRTSQQLEKGKCPTHLQERQEGESGELQATKPYIRPGKIMKLISHKIIFQAHKGLESDWKQPSSI